MNSLSYHQAQSIIEKFGSPLFLYDEAILEAQTKQALEFPNAYGLTVRYAMKAAPNAHLLKWFDRRGIEFDASSGWEVKRLLKAGIDGSKISLSTQELPEDFAELVQTGLTINACSLSQLESIGKSLPGTSVGIRFNPGLGSGGTNRTNVGGHGSSFGIWHEKTDEVKGILKKYDLKAFRIHTHIGSGSDPEVWQRVAQLSLNVVRQFESVTVLNLGGGYKVARVANEKSTDLKIVGAPVKSLLEDFAKETQREIHFEIEPGTFLIANAGSVVSKIQDVVDTGNDGYRFIKLDTGMTDILRPSMYGAQHPFSILQEKPSSEMDSVVVVGHCCESGDILTPAPGDPELLQPRELPKPSINDVFVIGGAGAYCSAMSAKNYNSFPESPEIFLHKSGDVSLIRKRQTLDQILQNEISID